MPVRSLDALLAPRRVAVVGASDVPGKLGTRLMENLAEFPGEVVAVSARSSSVAGRPSARSLRDVRPAVDLAVVAVPAEAVPEVARDAAAAGVPAMVVLSGGFAEVGPAGARLQHEVMEAARAGGVRVVGPNCFGVQNCDARLNASMAVGLPAGGGGVSLPAGGGGVSLITQSGAYGMAAHTVAVEAHVPFAKVVSIGNAVDVGAAELLHYLRDDPATAVCCVVVEDAADVRDVMVAVASCVERKPVVVVKNGRSPSGARAAGSHTAALAGRADLWDAALRAAGATVVRSGLEMIDAARLLASQPLPRGNRAAVVTNSGGIGVELVDLLTADGVAVPELPPGLQAQLAESLPEQGSAANPVDLLPDWPRFAERYPALVERLARSGAVDIVIPVLVERAAADDAVARALVAAVQRLQDAAAGVAVACCWVASRDARPNAELLQRSGIPCFEWPERTARAVGHAVRARRARTGQPLLPLPLPRPARQVAAPPDAATGAELLGRYGVATVATEICRDVEDAVAAARRLGHPAVVKLADPGVAHRSDSGGVRTRLAGDDAVRAAAEVLLARTRAGVLVQPHRDGVELVVGGFQDPQFGPTVLVGVGGIFVEILDDVVFAPAPVTAEAVARLLPELRAYGLLTGARGTPAVDLDAVVAVVRGVGDLVAAHPEIAQLDLNPVTADADGAVAVDWAVVLGDAHPTGTGSRPAVRPGNTTLRR